MNKRSPIALLFFTIFLDLLGFSIVIPILPIYATELGANALQTGIIAGVYSLMNFLFSPFWGALSDRVGRRPVILTSIAIATLGYVGLAFSTTLLMLGLARTISGIGSANISVAQAFIVDITDPKDRPKALGLVGAAFGLGFVFGPPIGGIVKQHYGAEYVGYLSAGLCVLNLVLAYFILPESLKNLNKEGKFNFITAFKNLANSLNNSKINLFFFLNFLLIVAFAMMQITIVTLWEKRYHLSETSIGLLFMYVGTISALVQGLLIGRINKRLGEYKMMILGAMMIALGLGLIPFVTEPYFYPATFVLITLISGGSGLMTPSISSLISKSVGMHEQGAVLGANMSFGSLARAIGPPMGGFLYDIYYGYPYFTGSVIMLMACYFSYALFKRSKVA